MHYTETLLLPPSQIAWIGSIQVFLTFAISAFSGRLADAGYARHAVLVGTTLCVLGTFMTSLAETYWQIFLAQGICEGLGMGIMYMPAVTGRSHLTLLLALRATGPIAGKRHTVNHIGIGRLTRMLMESLSIVIGTYFARKRTMGTYTYYLSVFLLV